MVRIARIPSLPSSPICMCLFFLQTSYRCIRQRTNATSFARPDRSLRPCCHPLRVSSIRFTPIILATPTRPLAVRGWRLWLYTVVCQLPFIGVGVCPVLGSRTRCQRWTQRAHYTQSQGCSLKPGRAGSLILHHSIDEFLCCYCFEGDLVST